MCALCFLGVDLRNILVIAIGRRKEAGGVSRRQPIDRSIHSNEDQQPGIYIFIIVYNILGSIVCSV